LVVTVPLSGTPPRFRPNSPAMLPWDESSVNAGEEPSVAFIPAREDYGIEIVVNFGILTGRAATHAEIDRLSEWLLDEVDAVTIVGEERHEIGSDAEAVVNQVRIEVAGRAVPELESARITLQKRLCERADYWARGCVSSHADGQ
jgi:hypothetical protein